MTRQNFSKTVKAAALERSGGQCEAVGERYGLPAGVRCQNPIWAGHVEFDHYPRGAHDPHPDTKTAGNCVACCPGPGGCNQYAANHTDKQVEQRIKNLSHDEAVHRARMARKAGQDVPDPEPPRGRQGIKKPIKGRGFGSQHRPLRSRPSWR